jgi:hypothetical protein
MASGPGGQLEAGGEFRFYSVERVRVETGQEIVAPGALYELRRTGEESEGDAHQRGRWDIAGGEVHEQSRAGGQGGATRFEFRFSDHKPVEPFHVTEFLVQQIRQLGVGHPPKKAVQPALEGGAGETGGGGSLLEGELPERVVRLQPVVGKLGEDIDDGLGGTRRQVLGPVTAQGLAGLGKHPRTERGIGGEVGDEIAGKVHECIKEQPRPSAARARPA